MGEKKSHCGAGSATHAEQHCLSATREGFSITKKKLDVWSLWFAINQLFLRRDSGNGSGTGSGATGGGGGGR